jgi:hypothetical protein
MGETPPTHTSGSQPNGSAVLQYAGIRATATASIEPNPDLPNSYGDNVKFKSEAADLLFDTNNPFGEVVYTPASTPVTFYADSTDLTADSTTITTDLE